MKQYSAFVSIYPSTHVIKLSPDNLLEGFGVYSVFVPQLLIMLIDDFNEI